MNNSSFSDRSVGRVSLAIIAIVLTLAALKVAQDIAAPLVLAIVVGVIFAPLADRLERLKVPRGLVAIFLIVSLVLIGAALAYMAEPYVSAVIDRIPSIKLELQKLMFEYRDLIRGIDEMNKEMEAALGAQASEGGAAAAMPGLTDALFLAPIILAQVLIFLGGLFFFLLTRNNIYRWLSVHIGNNTETALILERFCGAERTVSRYFAAISVINAGLGFAVGAVLMTMGVPGAIVWGISAALLNFVLYLGPAAMAMGLLLAGIVNFDGLMTFAPAAAYLLLNMTEAQFVTPSFVGRHVDINPFLIFVALVFWLWLWGPLGGIVAIPVTLIILRLLDIFEESPGSPHPRNAA